MRFAGMPLWTIVLVACAALPFVLRAWIDAEQRRSKARTLAILKEMAPRYVPTRRAEHGPPRATSPEDPDSTPGDNNVPDE